MMRGFLIVAALASGCASSPPSSTEPARVVPATLEMVAGCKYLDDVTSVSSRYGIFAERAQDDTKAAALRKAADIGATHIVWAPPAPAHGSTTSSGRAYRCEQ